MILLKKCYTFAKRYNRINMETTARIQTAFRLPEPLVIRLKSKAKLKGKSLNSFVEEILEEAVPYEETFEEKIAHLTVPDEIPQEILNMCGCLKITEKDLEGDDRALYIWNK